jgi:hypothetical protein
VHAAHARGGRLGRTEDSAWEPNSNKKTLFFFKTVLEITNQFEFKSNLNFNDFYSHNKIQEHFIRPRKIYNGMNATNDYLFKYITLLNSILFENQGVTVSKPFHTRHVVALVVLGCRLSRTSP